MNESATALNQGRFRLSSIYIRIGQYKQGKPFKLCGPDLQRWASFRHFIPLSILSHQLNSTVLGIYPIIP